MAKLNIGQEFSSHPIGRYYSDGEGSGEQFREEYLKQALALLAEGEKLEVILDDGVEGYGSSFLVEAFAGLIKFGYIKNSDLNEKLSFIYADEDFSFYEKKIFQYIDRAKYGAASYSGGKR